MKIVTTYTAVITNVCRFFHTIIVFKRVFIFLLVTVACFNCHW